MESLVARAASLVIYAGIYKYAALFIIALLEGPVLMVVAGFLSRIGLFSWTPAYLTLLFGDLVGDICWYAVGRFGAAPIIKRFGHLLDITEDSVLRAEKLFHNNGKKILFTSKITMGFGFALATLMAAGAVRVPLKKFVLMNFLGGIVWTGMLFGLGYFFGNIYYQVAKEFRILTLVASTVVLSAAVYGFGSAMRKRYTKPQ